MPNQTHCELFKHPTIQFAAKAVAATLTAAGFICFLAYQELCDKNFATATNYNNWKESKLCESKTAKDIYIPTLMLVCLIGLKEWLCGRPQPQPQPQTTTSNDNDNDKPLLEDRDGLATPPPSEKM